MSTTATITMRHADTDNFATIYVNFDGYLAGVGATLLAHYDTDEKVAALIELGNLSTLGAGLTPDAGTTAYHRDLGEDWHPNKPSTGRLEAGADFSYIWQGGGWAIDGNSLADILIA